ncbi:TPA: FaeA/PapI family transcriptional regulator [Escherichia coli]
MKDNILTFLTELKTPCRTTEIAIHFGLSAYQARYYLMTIEKEGKIKRSPVR